MKRTTTNNRRDDLPKTFDELNHRLPLRPIQDDTDLENAQEMTDALAVLRKRTTDQEDYLESLSTLIEKYEEDVIDTSKLTTVEILGTLMNGRGMNGGDLGDLLGNRSLGYTILRGERELSKSHIMI